MKINQKTKSQIQKHAISYLKEQNIHEKANLHIYNEVLEKDHILKAGPLEIKMDRRTAFVFVDLAPNYNWAHPVQYLLYDAETGNLHNKVNASFPPSIAKSKLDMVEAFHTPVKQNDILKQRKQKSANSSTNASTNAPNNAPGKRYAILFAGLAQNRHTNDLEFLYRTLIDDCGFNAANIQVCNHDGTLNYFLNTPWGPSTQTVGVNLGNWPGNNTAYRMVVNHPGTRAGFQAALNTIASQIKAGDFLFIHTNNHGGGPCDDVNDYCMFEYDANVSWNPYYVNDFVSDLKILPTHNILMVMMEQCRSGGFVNPIISNSPATNTHVATSVIADEYSQGSANFDPFAYDWIAATAGRYPDGSKLKLTVDTNNDNAISAAEVFAYADSVHTHEGRVLKICQGIPLKTGDSPTSADSPNGCGASIFLRWNLFVLPFVPPVFVASEYWGKIVPPGTGDTMADIISILKGDDSRRQLQKIVFDYKIDLISAQLEESHQSPIVVKQLQAAKKLYENVQKLL